MIHEIKKQEVGAFFSAIVEQTEAQKQAGTPVINWIDGIAFVIAPFPPTPETLSESLKGIVHYAVISFTETGFQEEKRAMVKGREFPVRLRKADDNSDFVELVKYLKSFKPV